MIVRVMNQSVIHLMILHIISITLGDKKVSPGQYDFAEIAKPASFHGR